MKNKFFMFAIALILILPLAHSIDQASIEYITNQYSVSYLIKSQYDELKKDSLSPEVLSKFKAALPISLKLNITDSNETIFINVNKEGVIGFPDSMQKTDLEISIAKKDFIHLFSDESISAEEIKSLINDNKLVIHANSFKAEVFIIILEGRVNFTIDKHKGLRARTISYISAKLTSLFIPKQ